MSSRKTATDTAITEMAIACRPRSSNRVFARSRLQSTVQGSGASMFSTSSC
jgi:hypothetical protein